MRPGGPGALARCVGDVDAFVADAWGRRPHLRRGADLGSVLTLDDVDHLVAETALRAPAFRLVRAGAPLAPSAYTRTARIGSRTVTDLIDVGRVHSEFAAGATIVLQGLHRYWPPATELCRALADELTHPVQANAYLTPPVAQGLRVHADAHDVFAVQTHGRKQWVLYEGQRPPPDGAGHTPSLDTELVAGDVLYLPTGCHHAARTVDAPSLHLTIGVRAVTWADVVADALRSAGEDPALQEHLPVGFAEDPAALTAEASRRLLAAVERITAEDVAASAAAAAVERAAARVLTARQPDLRGQIAQILRAEELEDTTVVRRRPGAVAAVRPAGGRVELVLTDRTLHLPAHAEPALRAILAAVGPGTLRPADLAEHLDEPGRRTLVRRLVREGLLVVDG